MKRLLLLPIAVLGGIAVCAETPAVHNVYILPMAGGFDQYLAEELTRDHVMQVVTDPKLADAVLTDRIGESFEQKLVQIRPRDESEKKVNPENAPHSFRSSDGNKGILFLVDPKSRQVLWSDREKPLRNLSREAGRIAKKLATAFGAASPRTSKPASS